MTNWGRRVNGTSLAVLRPLAPELPKKDRAQVEEIKRQPQRQRGLRQLPGAHDCLPGRQPHRRDRGQDRPIRQEKERREQKNAYFREAAIQAAIDRRRQREEQ